MPTYNYKCTKCHQVFDAFHSMSCTDTQFCPDCNAPGTKLMSAGSVIFKGSGFYSTDYRDSGYLEAQKKESDKTNGSGAGKDTSKPDKTADTSTTSKPATKSSDSSSSSTSSSGSAAAA